MNILILYVMGFTSLIVLIAGSFFLVVLIVYAIQNIWAKVSACAKNTEDYLLNKQDYLVYKQDYLYWEGLKRAKANKADRCRNCECCAVFGGVLFRRYDAKKGKEPPEGAIPCQRDPDPVTGHWPHWVECHDENPADKWYLKAFHNTADLLVDGTYEAIGPHFQGNPYHLPVDVLERHGSRVIEVERSFDGIREFLRTHSMEGIVFWKDGEPRCKIKRSDFGFAWPDCAAETELMK